MPRWAAGVCMALLPVEVQGVEGLGVKQVVKPAFWLEGWPLQHSVSAVVRAADYECDNCWGWGVIYKPLFSSRLKYADDACRYILKKFFKSPTPPPFTPCRTLPRPPAGSSSGSGPVKFWVLPGALAAQHRNPDIGYWKDY